MKVGIYVSAVGTAPGFEKVVSGHVQVPLKTVELLVAAGVDVELITSVHNAKLPAAMPAEVKIHEVSDARIRKRAEPADAFAQGTAAVAPGEPARAISPAGLVRQVWQLRNLVKEREFDIVHFFGHNGTAYLGGCLRTFGSAAPVVVTMVGVEPVRPRSPQRFLLSKVDRFIVSTEFGKLQLKELGFDAIVIKHGPIRDILSELPAERSHERKRVLFWRDPSRWNGADVCLEVFKKVAPKYPEISFDFAVRPFYDEVPGLDDAAATHDNINVYRFPYTEGISLAGLLSDSICVVTPFETTSLDPQLSLAETLAAGVAVITTDIRSNGELVRHGVNGLLVPPSDPIRTADALVWMLENREKTLEMGAAAPLQLAAGWNWEAYPSQLIAAYESVVQARS